MKDSLLFKLDLDKIKKIKYMNPSLIVPAEMTVTPSRQFLFCIDYTYFFEFDKEIDNVYQILRGKYIDYTIRNNTLLLHFRRNTYVFNGCSICQVYFKDNTEQEILPERSNVDVCETAETSDVETTKETPRRKKSGKHSIGSV